MKSSEEYLSELLFHARTSLNGWADGVESQSGQPDDETRELVRQIDEYLSSHGWSPTGWSDY